MTFMRSVWARMPEAATAMDLEKSISLSPTLFVVALAHTLLMPDRCFHQRHGLGIEIGGGLEFGLCLGDLDHLGFQRHRIAIRAGFLVRRVMILELTTAASAQRDVTHIGGHH